MRSASTNQNEKTPTAPLGAGVARGLGVTPRERVRKVRYYSASAWEKMEDAQVCIATLYEIAKGARTKRLEEVEKMLREAHQHLSEAKRLVKIVGDMVENDLAEGDKNGK